MMKRVLSLMLSLIVLLTCVSAWGEEDYSLAEKLQRQIDFGNGVKGAVMVHAAGDGALAQLLAPLNDTEIQIRSIKDQNSTAFQLYLYTLDGEKQVGLTRLYGDDQDVYMSSDLLPELILTYHVGGDWLDTLMAQDSNANWYTAVMNLLTVPESIWEEEWVPLLEGYYADLEMWLAEYAAEPQVNQSSDGETLMTVRYEIPADAVKAQIKVLLQKALQDEALMTLVRGQTTEEQQFTYLTPGLMYYYEAAIDAVQMEGEITLERDLSTMGETMSTLLQLPLPAATGWNMLTLDQNAEEMIISLTGEQVNISVEMETAKASATSADYSGVVRVIPAADDAQAASVAFRLAKVFSHSVDDDTREHDVTTWTLELAPDESAKGDEDYLFFEPVTASLMTHIHSKSAKRNATTLEVSAGFTQGSDSFSVAGSIKTASPWVLDQLPVEGAESIENMTDSYLMEIMGTLWENLQADLAAMKDGEIPVPELASATDTAAEETPATNADLTP